MKDTKTQMANKTQNQRRTANRTHFKTNPHKLHISEQFTHTHTNTIVPLTCKLISVSEDMKTQERGLQGTRLWKGGGGA